MHESTRASARKCMNTPCLCQFLKYKNNSSVWQDIRQNQWTMKYRSLTHIFYEIYLCVTLIHYPKYNISPSNSLPDKKQTRWTIKYRSLTYRYLIRSISVSHWSIIPTMMFIHQIILKILSKITRPWNIGHVDLYLFWGQSLGHTVSLPENMTLIHQIVLEI